MASGKLSPRQKMINMMYLVLTALLALNVSKEILDSFVVVNNSLEITKNTLKQKVDETYKDFSSYAAQNKEKYGAAWASAQIVQKQAKDLMTYIDSIKVKVISETEGKPTSKLIHMDSRIGVDTLMNLHLVDKKDDYNIITHIMVGSEPAKPKDGPYTALDLKNKLTAFREAIKKLALGKNPTLIANVDKMFSFPDQKEAGDTGPVTSWETTTFYHIPLAAGVTILSKFQTDVRNAESECVTWLLGNVEKKSLKFSALDPVVVPVSNYVTSGSPFNADVYLAAYDPQNSPTVELSVNGTVDTTDVNNPKVVGESKTVPIGGDGKGKLEVAGAGVGEHELKGVITFTPVGGDVVKKYWHTKFEVAQPNLVVSPTKMNVFYRGVDNPVDVSVAGYSAKDIIPNMTNGTIPKDPKGAGYIVRPGKDPEAVVGVTVTNPDGTRKTMPGLKFRVKNVPNPAPYFGGKSVADETIKKTELTAAQGVIAKMENFEFDLKFEIVEYKLTMIIAGTPVEKITKGPALSDEMKQVIAKAKSGQKVYIEGVKARGPDGTLRTIGSLALKVI